MSLERINLIKHWTIVVSVFAFLATAAVAHYRIAQLEEADTKMQVEQKADHNLITDLRSDVRVMREILERMDPKRTP